MNRAADALFRSTTFNTNGLLSISCKDIDAWGELTNCVAALVLQGYRKEEEVLDLLLSSLLSNHKFRKAYSANAPPKWKAFEILVARLHIQQLAPLVEAIGKEMQLEDALGVQVYWDYVVEGKRTANKRQIDVAVISGLGLYSVFTAVECKDSQVEISDVEAFITKLQDIGAHKGVIATSVGFQDGAKRAAQAYGIETLHVEEQAGTKTITRSVSRFRPRPIRLTLEPPNAIEPRPLGYTSSEIKIALGSGKEMTDTQLMVEMLNTDEPYLGRWPPCIIRELPDGSKILLPDNTTLPISKVCIDLAMEEGIEEVLFTLPEHPLAFSVRNVISGTEKVIPASAVPITGPRNVQPGQFYINMMCQCYYCEKIENGLMTLVLLNDEQHGTTISARLTGELRYSAFYFLVEDPRLIEKLKITLDQIHKADRVAPKKLEH